jgi:hypothetical protein
VISGSQVATPSNSSAINLAIAGAVGAAVVAAGAFFMLPGKKKTKRGLKREEFLMRGMAFFFGEEIRGRGSL